MTNRSLKFPSPGLVTPLDKPWHRDAFIDASHRIAHLGYCEWDYVNGRIISCTRYYAEIFGMTIEEVVESQSTWEKVLLQLHPDDRERYAQSHEENLGRGTHEIEYRIFRKNGELRHIKEVGIVFFDDHGEPAESMGMLQDITEQKDRIQDLENRDAMAQQVEKITDIGHFIWEIDKQRYRFISPGYARILGTDLETHSNKIKSLDDYLDGVHEDDRQRVLEDYDDNLRNAEGVVIEYRYWRADGNYCWIREKSIIVKDSTNDIEQMIGVIQDITEQKKSEHSLLEAKDALEVEVESRTRKLSNTVDRLNQEMEEREVISAELESKNAELERYAYTVSHDLKSPLVTIKGFLGLLEKDIEAEDSERVAQDFEKLRTATDTMGALLNDLLELSRIGKIVGEAADYSLSSLVKRAIELVQSDLDERGVEIIVDDLPRVHCDETRLIEVFTNLIENAIKFMGSNESPVIRISAEPRDGMICCSVRDNGIGIAEQYHEQIFDLFERLDPQVSGTGVGLSLVKRIIAHHGGRTWVESDGPGTGCAMVFTLPQG